MWKCPNCESNILEKKDLEKTEDKENGIVLKTKLVFINDNGEVLGRCSSCKKIVHIPLKVTISQE